MRSQKLDSIQILRGIAALSVVMFHLRSYLVPEGADRSLPDALFGWGAIGVDLFFVISGFIMYYVTFDKKPGIESSKKFIINRAIRIIPLYYIVLIFAFLTSGAMSTFHYQEKIDNLVSALTFMPYLHEHAPLYILDSGMYNVRWTLNYELYFYLVFAFCLLFKHRLVMLFAWFILPAAISFFVFSNLVVSTQGYNYHSVIIKFVTNPIILEFGLGVASGIIYKKLKPIYKNKSFLPPFIILSLISMGIYYKQLTSYNLASGIAFSFLVLTFALHNKVITDFLPNFLITLGNISFSLYLIHNPLKDFISRKVEKTNPDLIHNTLGFVGLILISVIAAYFSYRYIETTLSSKLRNVFINPMIVKESDITRDERAN
ncbi:acyltransferase family protein [Enterobacter kobei]|uniref:acyltransferase family protein n=1 Tax=Enterobacter kobei TaxID=208224 RepID=UPI002A7FFEA8|nr:acyltransferase [Enterobacter kobei]